MQALWQTQLFYSQFTLLDEFSFLITTMLNLSWERSVKEVE